MNTIQSQLAAARTARARIEAEAWASADLGVPYPEDRAKLRAYLPHLEALMTPEEHRRWRSVQVTIGELERILS